jgi:hypothetical protein
MEEEKKNIEDQAKSEVRRKKQRDVLETTLFTLPEEISVFQTTK